MHQTFNPLLAVASGSARDVVASHNQYGPYTRARTTPTDPATARQKYTRQRVEEGVWYWQTRLTAAERRAWKTYALNVPLVNRIGVACQVHAFAMFMHCNAPRRATELSWITTPSTVFSRPVCTVPVITSTGAPGIFFLDIDPTDSWANEREGALFVYVSPVKTSAINFYKGPFRQAGYILGHATSPPPVSNYMFDPWGFTTGARRWARTYAVTADGRVSISVIRPFADNT